MFKKFCCVGTLIVAIIIGMVFQLGILGLAGGFFYTLRMFENVILTGLVTLFAFNSDIDCSYCADSETRVAMYNPRV